MVRFCSFALILALCVSASVTVLLFSQSQFFSTPQAAELASPSAHTGELPQLW
jgi:hypothetical protein